MPHLRYLISLAPNFSHVAVFVVFSTPRPSITAESGTGRLSSPRLAFGPPVSDELPGITHVRNERHAVSRGYGRNGQPQELIEFPKPPELGQPHPCYECEVHSHLGIG